MRDIPVDRTLSPAEPTNTAGCCTTQNEKLPPLYFRLVPVGSKLQRRYSSSGFLKLSAHEQYNKNVSTSPKAAKLFSEAETLHQGKSQGTRQLVGSHTLLTWSSLVPFFTFPFFCSLHCFFYLPTSLFSSFFLLLALNKGMRFVGIAVAKVYIVMLKVATLCIQVHVYRRFGKKCWLLLQDSYSLCLTTFSYINVL
jgi:hypothetical protein